MMTSNPGDALSRCWSRTVGRLAAGGFGDVTVVRAKGTGDVWSQIVAATGRQVMLVVYNGVPRYGDAARVSDAGLTPSTVLTVQRVKRRIAIPHPTDPKKAWAWGEITKRLDAVRKDPAKALKKADARRRAYAGRQMLPSSSC
jgi:hypothetical protein